VKSGVSVELVQKGRVGPRLWRVDDGSENGVPEFQITDHKLGDRPEIAVVISAAQSAEAAARAYCLASLPKVGRLIEFALGPSQRSVLGGGHAAALAESVANYLRSLKGNDIDVVAHVFAAAPNALLFYLGQQHQAIAPLHRLRIRFRPARQPNLPAFDDRGPTLLFPVVAPAELPLRGAPSVFGDAIP
jgi:hypothetical protein